MIEQNISLKKYNTFGIDAIAQYFSVFNAVDQLSELLEFKKPPTSNLQLPVLILGGGSNILFTKNFEGLVLKNEMQGIEKIKEDDTYV